MASGWGARRGQAAAEDDRDPLTVTHATSFAVFDCGEEIWLLLQTRRPAPNGDEAMITEEGWVVLPRSGALLSLMEAMSALLPGHHDTEGKPQTN
jgi:hypothetical protein